MSNFIGKALPFSLACLLSACAMQGVNPDANQGSEGDTVASNYTTNNSEMAPPVDEIGVGETGGSQGLLARSAAATVGIEFTGTTTGETFVLNTGAKVEPQFDVTRLENPDRLVIDISGAKLPSNKVITPKSSVLVSALRTGAHKDAARIVLDLSRPAKDIISASKGMITVALTPSVATNTTASAAASDTTIKQEEVAANTAAITRLTGLSLESLPGQGNVIIAEISNLKDFEFKKTAPSEYVANIPAASIDPVAQQPILASPNSGAIRSVRPTEKNGDIVLRIFAQPTSELVALNEGNKLVVRDNSLTAPDYRAQERVEPALPANESAKETSPVAATKEEGKKEEKKSEAKSEQVEVKEPISNDDLGALLGGDQRYSGRLISLDLQDTDIDNALRIIAEVSNLNIIASSDVAGKVTLRLIDVPWDQALDVILKTNGLDKVQEGNVVRIAPVEKLRLEREALKQARLAEDELEPLSVKYVRVSYAKATDLKPLVKSILTERGDVAIDERSNQVIIKDIRKGIKNAVDLISKLDLRTPQVLLETQIVEASRSIFRDLGSQLGFSFIQSPETGNATGFNFPNSIKLGGGIPNSASASSFPVPITANDGGSAISMIFGSADGTRSLDMNISALEKEGRVRIVSRPSVATINNKPAEIASKEVIRVRKPNTGNTTVVGGSGSGDSDATEKINVGITLKVTPQASPDYFVLMDIEAESSSFGTNVVDNIPSTIERKATSSVLVSSGQTFAIGGIYRLRDNDTVSGVPFLKDVPLLGTFFRRTKVDNADEELLFFITPRIIEGSFDDAAMSSGAS